MKRIITAAVIAASMANFSASAQQSITNPITQAMLDVYAQEIAANPKDPDLYFRRANEYYKFNQYLRALADVDKTLEYVSDKNTDLQLQAYLLRADIYQMLNKHEEALADFTKAYEINPTSFMALYQKANEEYELGDYTAAKADYTRLRSTNPRSTEALTGLARVAVKENNLGLASEYMDGAVEMMSADSDIYVRRATVRRMQNNNTGAVEDLLMAISIDNNTRAFEELIEIANVDYPAVISGLSTSISYAPQQGMLYYIRGFIAQAHDHYNSALADYRKLIDQNMYEYAGLYNSIAQCQLALCQYGDALDNVDQALAMADNGEYYATKAKIYYALGKNDEANQMLNKAINKGYSEANANELRGWINFAQRDYSAANDLYASLIIDQPDVMSNYIYRAWVLADGMKQASNAQSLYNRVVSLTADDDATTQKFALTAIRSYRGFALLFSGKKDEALQWADNLQRDYKDTDGYMSYIIACLYAQANESDKAFQSLERALQLGYSNLYEISVANVGRISLAPIRKDARFNALIARYAHLFE
jgi:tetratricopeptide (TPR) repeat protein